ncbi:MAG: toxin [Bacteroidota bacterium]
MDILWDDAKSKRLRESRGISFEDIAEIILEKRYLAILENPVRSKQRIFIVSYKAYTYVVPFVIDTKGNIVLKTVFPSRKFHKLYGKKK